MAERRIFFYSGKVDEAFKEAAKKSLIEAKWTPICEISEPLQILACAGPDRQTCILQRTDYRYAIVAERA